MKVLARIDYSNKVILEVEDFDVVSNFKYHHYYNYTYSDDKFVIIQLKKYYYLVDNSLMYNINDGIFNDKWDSPKHKEFKSFEEALMYATTCI